MGGRAERRLAKCHNIDDLRTAASQRLPFPIFDFLDGAAEDERTLDRNRSSFDRYLLMPRILQDVSEADLRTTVVGTEIAMPVIVSPTVVRKTASWMQPPLQRKQEKLWTPAARSRKPSACTRHTCPPSANDPGGQQKERLWVAGLRGDWPSVTT